MYNENEETFSFGSQNPNEQDENIFSNSELTEMTDNSNLNGSENFYNFESSDDFQNEFPFDQNQNFELENEGTVGDSSDFVGQKNSEPSLISQDLNTDYSESSNQSLGTQQSFDPYKVQYENENGLSSSNSNETETINSNVEYNDLELPVNETNEISDNYNNFSEPYSTDLNKVSESDNSTDTAQDDNFSFEGSNQNFNNTIDNNNVDYNIPFEIYNPDTSDELNQESDNTFEDDSKYAPVDEFNDSTDDDSSVEDSVSTQEETPIEISDTPIEEINKLTEYEDDNVESTDINSLFDRVSVNFKEASDIFKRNTEMKEKIDSRFEDLKKLQSELDIRKKTQLDEVNAYKDEVFTKLTEKKEEIEKRLNLLKDQQANFEKTKMEFEEYRKNETDNIERIKREVQSAYDERREELNKVEDVLRKQKELLDEERSQLSLDKIQYESDKNELANNLLKFNELVNQFTNGVNSLPNE